MTEQYKRMEQKLQSEIDTLIGDVEEQEKKINQMNQDINSDKVEKE
tara:strand:- start:201 stop:338 length:138 start_codon:yes stop_codon:yes gene_type:complete